MSTALLTRPLTSPLTATLNRFNPAAVVAAITAATATANGTNIDVTLTSTVNLLTSNGGTPGVVGILYSIGVGVPPTFWQDVVADEALNHVFSIPFATIGAVPGDTVNVQPGFSLTNPAGAQVLWGATITVTVAGDVTAPVLSSPTVGTPTSVGATAPQVTTDTAEATLYRVVVTDAGSATNAQIIAGSGGNIVQATSQAVTVSGVQTTANITGLSASTNYEIIYLHVDAAGNESNQAAVGLTTSAVGDPNFSNVILLVGNNSAADGTTAIIDQSPIAASISVSGDVRWRTAGAPAGLTSWLRFGENLATSNVLTPASANYNLPGDFTIRGKVRFLGAGSQVIVGRVGTDGVDRDFNIIAISGGAFIFQRGFPGFSFNLTIAASWAENTVYDFEVTRSGNVYRTFFNGALANSTTESAAAYSTSQSIRVGRNVLADSQALVGNCLVEIYKGVALHTASFTPSDLPYLSS